ncbi:four-carbon acid sugar kinase family protein [Streptomyces sp. NPDC053499]|uniref:four-carbon acid sugar kinase family protein n=1 Tax=Streptomyces sp. NPDC053499 TaxID=3365707 RepID=UPI0037CF253A
MNAHTHTPEAVRCRAPVVGPAVLIVADDLTGANATAAGFARTGMRAVTVGAHQDPATAARFGARFDAVVVSTDSRHCPPEEAAERVRAVIRHTGGAALVSHRVDSTLRGNLGASTQAALRAVSEQTGRRAVALCAPAHPEAGRQTVQGTQLWDGARLEDTEVARDPRSPLPTSQVADLLHLQAPGLSVAQLPLSAVTGSEPALRALVEKRLADGVDVLVADALTTSHLDRIADAAVRAAPVGVGEVVWVGVDPGPSSLALATAMGLTGGTGGAPVLAVSGSTTRLTRTQLSRLRAEHPVVVVRPCLERESSVPDVTATAEALGQALATAGPGEVVLLATVLDEADIAADCGAEDAERLPGALARSVRGALERHDVPGVEGLFSTGGDVSAALFAELGAHGLDVAEELVPLAVAGTFVGGPWAGLPVVTKGGLVGDAGTTSHCVTHLRRAAAAARRQVPAADAMDPPPPP